MIIGQPRTKSEPPPLRIKSIRVTGLFDKFDHDIPLHTDERITIIHGPNGVGKTMVLRIIAALFSSRFALLSSMPFAEASVSFLGGGTLSILRSLDADRGPELKISYAKGDFKEACSIRPFKRPTARMEPAFPIQVISDLLPFLERVHPDRWRDKVHGDLLALEEVIERYSDRLPSWARTIRVDPIPKWLADISQRVPTQFIETQRLRASQRHSPEEARGRMPRRPDSEVSVEVLAEDLATEIKMKMRDSGAMAASLDRTFPHRVLAPEFPVDASDTSVRELYMAVEELRNRLMKAGLLQAEGELALPERELSKHDLKVLWHYLHDVSERLEVYRDLLSRVELFKDIIDSKAFLCKRLEINKDVGFEFRNEAGIVIPLSALSSGEQHEVVLAFELLFRAHKKSLVLIDEPELSLHVSWQERFLADMLRIAEIADVDFIVATHSPTIVGERSHLMVELGSRSR